MKTSFLLILIINILSTGFVLGQEISKPKKIPVQEEFSHKSEIENIKVFQPQSGAKELTPKDTTSIKEGNESILSFIKDLVVIVASLTVIFSFLFIASFPARKNQQLQAVIQYFQQGDSDEQRKARKMIYTSSPIDEDSGSKVCSFFHFWGLMVKRGLLPIWVFESSSGIQVLELYNKLEEEEFIKKRQEKNSKYAEHFVWLKNKIKNKYNHIC